MATRYFQATGTDWSSAGSWESATGGAGAVPLTTADQAVFRRGSPQVTSGLNQSAVDLVDAAPIRAIHITRNCVPTIGTSGSSLQISSTGTFHNEAGGGRVYLTAGSANIANVICDTLGEMYLTGGNFDTSIIGSNGLLNINDSVGLSAVTLRINGSCNCTIEYAADVTDPTIVLDSGFLWLKRPTTALTINGGRCILEVRNEASAGTAITLNGGRLDWRLGDGSITANGGFLDFSNAADEIALTATVQIPANVIGNRLVTQTSITLGTGRLALYGGPALGGGGGNVDG